MGTPGGGESLADKHHISLVVRLVIDRYGQLVHGEVLDVEGLVHSRFARWADLTGTVRRLVSSLVERDRAGAKGSDEERLA